MCNVKIECKCEPKPVGHIHAELMKQYAEDAKTTDEPWILWEFSGNNEYSCWSTLESNPKWLTILRYRRKPHTHVVNGIEVPAPLNSKPKADSVYWIADPSEGDYTTDIAWYDCVFDRRALERGLAHATKEAAVANAMAMIGRKVP